MALNFVVCVSKEGLGDLSGDDLEIGHIYEVAGGPDPRGWLQIIDQSAEAYWYPAQCFEPVSLTHTAADRLHNALEKMAV